MELILSQTDALLGPVSLLTFPFSHRIWATPRGALSQGGGVSMHSRVLQRPGLGAGAGVVSRPPPHFVQPTGCPV